MIHVAVNGIEPAPQGSKRHIGHGRMLEVSKRVKPWRQEVAKSAQQQMQDQNCELITVPCCVTIEFRFKRPKAHRTTNGQLKANAPEHCIVKRNDIDKCCRSTLDALTDVVIADDCLVVRLIAGKRYCFGSEQPGAIISVMPVD